MGNITTSKYMLSIGATLMEIYIFATMIFAAKAVGGDGGDKTINYELLNGHSRTRVYWSRIITGILWSVLLVVITNMVPYGIFTLINGWGEETAPMEIFIRLVMAAFPIMRISAIFMLLTSLVESAGGGMAISYGVAFIETIMDAVLDEVKLFDKTYVLGLSNLSKLMRYNNSWEFVENGHTVTWFDYSISNDMILKTAAFSILATAVYLIIGYVVFRKRDRN
jgi:ABC-type transport system involved in multi-copper enzyme maturation permease subunit